MGSGNEAVPMTGAETPDSVGTSPDRRKLIAVVHADMVGYSRLIGLDDIGTLERLRRFREELIDPAIEEHRGRLVSTGGDSLLIVFDSIDGAVRCAAKVQQEIPILDADQSPERAVRFRIGINLGDAIADGTDLHGDVVNVAARLQAECPPGGICVSQAVRDHVHGRLGLKFEELGKLNLKNITRPVEAFVLRLDIALPQSVERTFVPGVPEVLPLPDKPSIAVLAFSNMSGDPDQEYFSDGVAEDIITELSRSRSLLVIARNSSFTYKGRAVDVKLAARELGVRYMVEGSVRHSRDRVRVTAQLIDAVQANHVWGERYDRDVKEVFAVQDEITTAVVTAILPAIADAELRRVLRRPPESFGAWDAYQRGLWHLAKCNALDNEQAIAFFHNAIAEDITFTSAYNSLVAAYLDSGLAFSVREHDEARGLADIWARKAAEIDRQDAEVQLSLGSVALMSGRWEEADQCALLALSLNPYLPRANFLRGSSLIFNGQPAEGRKALLTGLRLNPRDPRSGGKLNEVAISYYFERDYAGAAEAARRAIARASENPLPYRWLAAALGQTGSSEQAREALHYAMSIAPKSFDLYVRSRVPWHREEDYQHMLDGLRKAGWEG
jgi:adenylate cyclase